MTQPEPQPQPEEFPAEQATAAALYLTLIAAWIAAVTAATFPAAGIINPFGILSAASLYTQTITNWLRQSVRPMFVASYTQLFGPERAEVLFDQRPFVDEYIRTVENLLSRVPDETFRRVQAIVQTASTEGTSIPDTAAQIRETLLDAGAPYWTNRAETVARTEILRAHRAGQWDSYLAWSASTGIPLRKRWLCVAGDTAVKAYGVKAAARRSHVGTLVRITTASGSSFAVTPEHPVLTSDGWLRADVVQKGSKLFKVGCVDAALGAPDVHDSERLIGELVDTAIQAVPVEVRTVCVCMDLNDDSVSRDVEVVAANGNLARYLEPAFGQEGAYLRLATADLWRHVALFGAGCGGELPITGGDAAPQCCPVGGAFGAQVTWLAGDTDVSCCALVPQGHTGFAQDADDGRAGAPYGLGDHGDCEQFARVEVNYSRGVDVVTPDLCCSDSLCCASLGDGFGTLEVTARGFRNGQDFAACTKPALDGRGANADDVADLRRRLASAVQVDDVVNVEVEAFVGHVYDLSTEGGWYMADGIIIHNSTDDARTRPAHWEADQQERPILVPYSVGGFPAMYPGDPLLPPDLSINCRCESVYEEVGERPTSMSDRAFRSATS